MLLDRLKDKFVELYGDGDIFTFFSPSRINLIGEHIDYNGGRVLPAAINIGTYGLVRKRADDLINLTSENIDLKVTVSLEDVKYDRAHGWGNYPKGVLYFMKEREYNIGGMDILVKGNIPNGAGLSSSASLELLIAEMANILFNNGEIPMLELVKLCQRAENEFIGVRCGIMDQFAIGMGKKNKVILLDTNTLEYEYIEISLGDNALVVMDTNKRRELSDSKYNERRAECEEGLKILQEFRNINSLCDLSIEEYNSLKSHISDDKIRKRVKHVVYENNRVNLTSTALRIGDIESLGKFLIESHNSLKDLYEVTGIELDSIVNAANSFDFCLGARMMGAGFGGCAIAIVEREKLEEFMSHVERIYKKEIGKQCKFYIAEISDGTRQLNNCALD
ncbi:MAG: galactokinase [Tissierellales bacterium]|nr:galactokinase [Tissierellales bacterium]